jgi:hypothetical protein
MADAAELAAAAAALHGLGETAAQQRQLERTVADIYGERAHDPQQLALLRAAHAQYLLGGLRTLSAGHCGAQRPAPRACAAAFSPAAPQAWTPAARGSCSGSRTASRCWRCRCRKARRRCAGVCRRRACAPDASWRRRVRG